MVGDFDARLAHGAELAWEEQQSKPVSVRELMAAGVSGVGFSRIVSRWRCSLTGSVLKRCCCRSLSGRLGRGGASEGGLTDDASIDHDVKFRSRGSRGVGYRRLVCVA